MRDPLLEIRISRGELRRNIATDVWPAGGSLILGQPTEHLPPELITALDRHLDEFEPIIGTWNYTVGDADYQVAYWRFAAGFFSCHSVDCHLSLNDSSDCPVKWQ